MLTKNLLIFCSKTALYMGQSWNGDVGFVTIQPRQQNCRWLLTYREFDRPLGSDPEHWGSWRVNKWRTRHFRHCLLLTWGLPANRWNTALTETNGVAMTTSGCSVRFTASPRAALRALSRAICSSFYVWCLTTQGSLCFALRLQYAMHCSLSVMSSPP